MGIVDLSAARPATPRATAITDIAWAVIDDKRDRQRIARFRTLHDRFGLPLEMVAAIDPRDVNRQQLVERRLLDREEGQHWSDANLARALSHLNCWNRAVSAKRPICVFEHHALLRDDFIMQLPRLINALPQGWDFLQLGCNPNSMVDVEVTPDARMMGRFSPQEPAESDLQNFVAGTGDIAPLRMRTAFGCFAYVITPVGAQRLGELCFPLKAPVFQVAALRRNVRATAIDITMNRAFERINAYLAVPPLAMPVLEPTATAAASSPSEPDSAPDISPAAAAESSPQT